MFFVSVQYEKAFLAASGGFSSFFVVEEPTDATELFALLRRHELGRANALSLRILVRFKLFELLLITKKRRECLQFLF